MKCEKSNGIRRIFSAFAGVILAFLGGCHHSLTIAESLAELQKHYAHATTGRDGYYVSADPKHAYQIHPDIVLRRKDEIGQLWVFRFVNFSPVTLKLYPLTVYVNTHAAVSVPTRHDNNVLVKLGTQFYGLQPGETIPDMNVLVDDVDEAHHTVTLEQLYQLDNATLKTYNIDPKEQGIVR